VRSSTPRRRPLCLGASFAGSGRRDSPRRGLFLGPLAGEVMMVGRPASRSPFPVDRLDLPMPCSTEPAAGRRRIANTEHARARTGPRGVWVGEWFYLYPPPACPAADSVPVRATHRARQAFSAGRGRTAACTTSWPPRAWSSRHFSWEKGRQTQAGGGAAGSGTHRARTVWVTKSWDPGVERSPIPIRSFPVRRGDTLFPIQA
jgi:hypothetical protein